MIIQYGVQCFNIMNKPMLDPTEIPVVAVNVLVFARSEDQAIQKAKKYIKRENYRVIHVQEFKNPNDDIDDLRKQPWERNE